MQFFSQLVLSTHPMLFYPFLSPNQSFVVLSNFCHLLTLCYLRTFYFTYAPYKCTCCTHDKHKLSLLANRAHALCANTPSLLSRRLWPSCLFDLGGFRYCCGGFSKNNLLPLIHTFHYKTKKVFTYFNYTVSQ